MSKLSKILTEYYKSEILIPNTLDLLLNCIIMAILNSMVITLVIITKAQEVFDDEKY